MDLKKSSKSGVQVIKWYEIYQQLSEVFYWTPDKISNLTLAQLYWYTQKAKVVSARPGQSVGDLIKQVKDK